MRSLLASAAVGLLALGVSACGVETSDEPVTIIPIGDSITQSFQTSTYRCYLDQMLNEADISFDFVGSKAPSASLYTCPAEFDLDHEAVSGATIRDRSEPAIESVKLLQPDVALIHLGSNDLRQGRSDEAPADLASLIEGLQVASPDITILVAQIIPCRATTWDCGEAFPAFNDAIASFSSLSTDRSTVVVVDMYSDFDLDDLTDDVHPSAAGEEEMARRWMAALEESGVVEA